MQMLFKDGKNKALTFSYDDGNYEDAKLIDIFDRNGLKATFNINTGLLKDNDFARTEPRGKLTWKEAEELYGNSGHEVAVHTLTHPWLATLSPEEIIREVIEDKKNIEEHFHTVTRGMAYPFGCYSAETPDILRKCGIVYSRTTVSTHGFIVPENWLTLPATCHHNDDKLFDLAKRFVEEQPKWGLSDMFYVWGHSYEFDRNNNWERMEEFAKYTGGRDNIWYATNIEIYDYVQAYRNLNVSYDCRIIHNPSSLTVWFLQNREAYSVRPGETLEI